MVKKTRFKPGLGICVDGRNVIKTVIKGAILEESIIFLCPTDDYFFRYTLCFRYNFIA